MTQFMGQSWDDLMNSHTLKWGQDDKGWTELNEIFFSLKGFLERKNNIHWHLAYLEKYIEEHIVPFGLRLKLFPHFKSLSPDFKSK